MWMLFKKYIIQVNKEMSLGEQIVSDFFVYILIDNTAFVIHNFQREIKFNYIKKALWRSGK